MAATIPITPRVINTSAKVKPALLKNDEEFENTVVVASIDLFFDAARNDPEKHCKIGFNKSPPVFVNRVRVSLSSFIFLL